MRDGRQNQLLASYLAKGLLPYHGLGSGIKRALAEWLHIDFADDREGSLFTVTIRRKPVKDLDLADKDALKVQIKGQVAPINAPINDFQEQLLGFISTKPAVSYGELSKLTGKDRLTRRDANLAQAVQEIPVHVDAYQGRVFYFSRNGTCEESDS